MEEAIKYTLYIGTEDNTQKKVEEVISLYFNSFTIYKGKGHWTNKNKKLKIQTYIIEIIQEDIQYNIYKIIQEIETLLKQKEILITQQSIIKIKHD